MTQAADKLASSANVLATSTAHAMDKVADGAASAATAVANSSTAKSLDNALATMINSSVQGAGDAISWAKYQIPDVIHQLLMWKAVESGIIFSVFVVLSLIGLYLSKKFIKWTIDGNAEFSPITALCVLILSTPIIGVFNSLDWLKIWIAPKIYLIEYAANLMKATH